MYEWVRWLIVKTGGHTRVEGAVLQASEGLSTNLLERERENRTTCFAID